MEQNYLMNTYSRFDAVFDHGIDCYLYDKNGKKYVDFVGGIAVSALGYSSDKLKGAIKSQADKLLHCSNLYRSEPQMQLAQKLCENSAFDKAFFCNSGAEANEAALKLAKKYAKNKGKNAYKFIAFKNSFHGRTIGALSLTGQEKYQKNFKPLMEGVEFADFNDIESVKNLIAPDICAIVLEPIQGEGGIIPADVEFLKEIRNICTQYDIALIFDEVQCGIGRCGALFAHQVYGVEPDILVLAKALAGGVPIGAMLAKENFANEFEPGDHASTFGGNLLATTAANVVLDEILEGDILDNVKEMSGYFLNKLGELKEKYDFITDVRGVGLMLGMEVKIAPKEIVNLAFKEGLLLLGAGADVVRFVPPLVINREAADEGFSILDKVLSTVNK